ncbi:MAG TPA: hypothetical protein VEC01_02745 [Noviherbaspirillum sp.]|uniref:hypothetical protein n=1 Tax=Noviherbaspirillum sp. TaxID=1926288 RepID=UPI002D5B2D34|nr:hypothetical protein [Noviherbaspirillum sp.]HYD94218.1 hypothetical protein [Noviherbaspirillum sp.]
MGFFTGAAAGRDTWGQVRGSGTRLGKEINQNRAKAAKPRTIGVRVCIDCTPGAGPAAALFRTGCHKRRGNTGKAGGIRTRLFLYLHLRFLILHQKRHFAFIMLMPRIIFGQSLIRIKSPYSKNGFWEEQ